MRSERQNWMTLTRAEYDAMIDAHPEWMREEWPKLKRAWQLGGVVVTQCAHSGLATKLNELNRVPAGWDHV